MSARERRRKRAERVERLAAARPSFRLRSATLVAFLGVFLVAVIWSAIQRQVIERDFLQHEGELRYLREWEIPARRGMILDRNGEPLAVSSPVATVWADPRKLVDQPAAVAELADALGMERDSLMERIRSRQERAFIYLKRRIDAQQAEAVQALQVRHDLTDLGLETEYRRFYPSGEIFGHVIGFTDVDDKGIEGMELAFEPWLRGEPGRRRVILDGRRHVVAEVERISAPRHGSDLVLSLDRRLQFLAYRELKRAVQKHRAKSASAVVLDVQSGEILAMVNQPAYNPNDKLSGAGSTRRNRAVTDVMEPGSTVKPLVVAAALEAGVVTPTTAVDTAPGVLRVGRNRVRDVRNHGRLDTTGVITKSSNVGVVKLAQRMDREVLWRLYDRLGFGRATGIRFPGEVNGRLPHYEGWSSFEHATLAFGYGVSVTPLQLASAYSVLAAHGVRHPPSLLRHAETAEGERILSAETARKVRLMLETVVSEKGTARLAAVHGYRVAGKTGTAKKAVRGGYARRAYQSVFAGMAPASDPRFVMVVMVDEPGGKDYYGGKVAAPVFSRVMEGALRLYNVAPDLPEATMLMAGTEVQR